MIKFHCPCSQKLNAEDSAAGRRVKCPKCGRIVNVPNPLLYHTELNELPDDDAETRKVPFVPPE